MTPWKFLVARIEREALLPFLPELPEAAAVYRKLTLPEQAMRSYRPELATAPASDEFGRRGVATPRVAPRRASIYDGSVEDETQSIFDDPQLAAEMRKRGIVHTPGMAAELMRELAPLLAADGIDIDAEEIDVDVDTLNAAMGRAVEQRNLELFTPVGQSRERVFALIREFATALEENGQQAAEALLAPVGPDPTATHPSAAHVIGATLGLIDTWLSAGQYAQDLGVVRLRPWRGAAKRVATELRALGSSGRAFDTLSSLMAQHGGKKVQDGALLLVASAALAVGAAEQIDVGRAFAVLQGAAGRRGEPAAAGSAFGLGADGRPVGSDSAWHPGRLGWGELLTDGFEASLHGLPEDDIEDIMASFSGVEALANVAQLDIHEARDAAFFIERIVGYPEADVVDEALEVLHAYVHFRLQDPHAGEAWQGVHDALPNRGSAVSEVYEVMHHAIAEARAVPEAEIAAALARVPAVAAVPEMLAWLGASKPVTSTGGCRRKDIGELAAMIGVRAYGVAKLPWGSHASAGDYAAAFSDGDDIIYAQTMWSVPPLVHWWMALQAADVTEVTASRVRPGVASVRVSEGALETPVAARLASVLAAEAITDGFHADGGWQFDLTMAMVEATILRVTDALGPAGYRAETYAPERPLDDADFSMSEAAKHARREWIVHHGVTRRCALLEGNGLLEERGGALVAPAALRGVVAEGLLMALGAFEVERDRCEFGEA